MRSENQWNPDHVTALAFTLSETGVLWSILSREGT